MLRRVDWWMVAEISEDRASILRIRQSKKSLGTAWHWGSRYYVLRNVRIFYPNSQLNTAEYSNRQQPCCDNTKFHKIWHPCRDFPLCSSGPTSGIVFRTSSMVLHSSTVISATLQTVRPVKSQRFPSTSNSVTKEAFKQTYTNQHKSPPVSSDPNSGAEKTQISKTFCVFAEFCLQHPVSRGFWRRTCSLVATICQQG